jgi:hypothetical protein
MRTRALGALGALLTLAAAAVLVRPGLADSLAAVAAIVESIDTERLLLGLGFAVGAYAAWAAHAGSDEPSPRAGPAARFAGTVDPPEAVSAADRTRTGASLDARIEAVCAGDEEALAAVRATLAETAANAHARAADRAPGDAHRAVETGAWTHDPVAAAFLAGDDGPGFSLLARLRAWLDPEAERRRRVERTVGAVDGVLDGWEGSIASNESPDDGGEER